MTVVVGVDMVIIKVTVDTVFVDRYPWIQWQMKNVTVY